jgi:uncharacterized membrane protein YeaQ/YmgE (transglycosylase-associated protein family)
MTSLEFVVGWLLIGLAAAIVAAILPFFRGVGGFFGNVVTGVGGAIALPLLCLATGITHTLHGSIGYFLAAAGAVIFLAGIHMTWGARLHRAKLQRATH